MVKVRCRDAIAANDSASDTRLANARDLTKQRQTANYGINSPNDQCTKIFVINLYIFINKLMGNSQISVKGVYNNSVLYIFWCYRILPWYHFNISNQMHSAHIIVKL